MQSTLEGWLSSPTVEKIVISVAGVLFIATIVHFLNRSVRSRISHPDTRYRAQKLTTFAGYLVSLLFVTTVFRDQLGHLAVALGITAAAVTLALQEVIASIAGWVAIPFGHFYQVGNRVRLGGVMGDVIDIGILRTTVMECGDWVNSDLYNGRIVRIANSYVFKEPVFNYSADFPFLWDEITVPVKYGSDYRLAREILQQIAEDVVGEFTARAKIAWREAVKKYRIEDESIEPTVTLLANDNWMEFTARYVVDYKRRRATKDELFTRILNAIDETHGRVAIASTTIHIVETPVLQVNTRADESFGHTPNRKGVK
jgi:small-conductance mechanosensitive channel